MRSEKVVLEKQKPRENISGRAASSSAWERVQGRREVEELVSSCDGKITSSRRVENIFR